MSVLVDLTSYGLLKTLSHHSKKNLRGNNFKEKNRQAKCGGFMVFFYFSVSLMLLLLRRCRSCHPRKGPSSRGPYPLCVPLCPPLAPCVPLCPPLGGEGGL